MQFPANIELRFSKVRSAKKKKDKSGRKIGKGGDVGEGLRKTSLLTAIRSRVLRLALRLPFLRFKAPKYLAALTPETVPPVAELRTEWERVRRQLEQTLNEFPSQLLNRDIFKHPRSGMLNIYQTLDFMLDHVLHHQKQLERIAKVVKR